MIIVGGTIGDEKITYMKALAESLAAEAFFHKDQTNPALHFLYDNPPAHGFLSQVYVPATGLASLRRASGYARNVSDCSLYEDLLHAQVAYELGYMKQEEKVVYDALLNELVTSMNDHLLKGQQTLFVLLKGSFDSFLRSVNWSAYSEPERKKLTEYYRAVHLRYEKWMAQFYTPSQLLVINTEGLHPARKDDRAKIIAQVHIHIEALGL